jgi:hypothetical protein
MVSTRCGRLKVHHTALQSRVHVDQAALLATELLDHGVLL